MTGLRPKDNLIKSPKSRAKILVGIAVLAVLALGLRLWALDWGLPLKFAHIDESVVVFYALRIAAGEWNSGFYDYPALFLNLVAGLMRAGHFIGWVFGLPNWETFLSAYQNGGAAFFTMTARCTSLVFALAGVAATVDAGRRWRGWFSGLGGGALLAANPLHVLHSHYGTVDMAAAFFTLVAMDRIAEYAQNEKRADGIAAAVAVGLGAATKYYPAVLALVLLGWALRHRPRHAGVFILAMAGGFLAGSPFTLLDFGQFWSRLVHLYPKVIGAPGADGVPWVPALRHLVVNAGILPCLLGAGGFFMAAKEKGYGRVFAISWGVLFLYIGVWRVQSAHYGLPLYAGLFIFAARGAEAFASRRFWAPAAILAAALAVSFVGSVRVLRYVSVEDSRLRAREWIRENVPPGARLLRFAHTPEFSRRDAFSVKVDFENHLLIPWAAGGARPEVFSQTDYLVYASHVPEGDAVLAALDGGFSRVFTSDGPAPRFPHHPRVFVFKVKP